MLRFMFSLGKHFKYSILSLFLFVSPPLPILWNHEVANMEVQVQHHHGTSCGVASPEFFIGSVLSPFSCRHNCFASRPTPRKLSTVLRICHSWWQETQVSLLLFCWGRNWSIFKASCSVAQWRSAIFSLLQSLIY